VFNFFKSSGGETAELPEIFPLNVVQKDFVRMDIVSTYVKILTDCIERVHGLKKEYDPLLWDNCVQTEANEGLITLIANAMADQKDLFLVFVPSVKVLRKATPDEESKIREDYKKSGESSLGVFLSFKKYRRTEMLLVYSGFEYCVLGSLNKTLNISKAVQIKINDLRASVSLADSEVAKGQGKAIAEALSKGKDVMLDVKDEITTASPDTSSTEKAIGFLDAKKSFILSLPISYVSGLQTPGIGSTGEADMRAVERGLKQYFVSIVRPVLLSLFKAETEFKSQDFRQMTTALEVIKTFDLVSDENMSRAAKQEIVARVFELDQADEMKNLKKEAKENEQDAEDGEADQSKKVKDDKRIPEEV
jgi:hypothetical protein